MSRTKRERFPMYGLEQALLFANRAHDGLKMEYEIMGLTQENPYFSRCFLYLISLHRDMEKEVALSEGIRHEMDSILSKFRLMRHPSNEGGKELLKELVINLDFERKRLMQDLRPYYR